MTRPVIGLTLDSEAAGGWSAMPWYALRENYSRAVTRAGGLPVLLPHEAEVFTFQGSSRAHVEAVIGLAREGRIKVEAETQAAAAGLQWLNDFLKAKEIVSAFAFAPGVWGMPGLLPDSFRAGPTGA